MLSLKVNIYLFTVPPLAITIKNKGKSVTTSPSLYYFLPDYSFSKHGDKFILFKHPPVEIWLPRVFLNKERANQS